MRVNSEYNLSCSITKLAIPVRGILSPACWNQKGRDFEHVQQSTQKRQASSFCFIRYIVTTQHHTSQTQRSRHKTTKMKLTQHILKPLLALYLVVSAEAKIRVCAFFRCVVAIQSKNHSDASLFCSIIITHSTCFLCFLFNYSFNILLMLSGSPLSLLSNEDPNDCGSPSFKR